MPGKRVADVSALITGAAISVSLAAFGVYINSAPIVSVSCNRCETTYGGSCWYATATDDFNLWGMISKHNWTLSAIYLTLAYSVIYAIALIVERFLVLYNAGRQSREFQSKAGEALFRGQATRAVCLAREYRDSPLAFVINETFAKQAASGEPRPSMRSRHLAIVARTMELKQGLWHLSAIGWSLAFQWAAGFRYNDSRITAPLRAPAHSDDWNIIGHSGV